MFQFFALIFSAVWIQEHLALVLCILGALILLVALIVHRRRARRRAYLALPVQFIGNAATKTFHRLDCPHLEKVHPANCIAFRLPAETARLGYRPCGACSPRWPTE